jgi:hypothetical protein
MNTQSCIESVSDGWSLEKTRKVHTRLLNLPDSHKAVFVRNWRIPHTLFNVAHRFWPNESFEGVDWYAIYKTGNLGCWENGNKVFVRLARL